VVEIDWNKLPIVLADITPANEDIYLRMQGWPEDEQFVEVIE
jgi:hypothetical protein